MHKIPPPNIILSPVTGRLIIYYYIYCLQKVYCLEIWKRFTVYLLVCVYRRTIQLYCTVRKQ